MLIFLLKAYPLSQENWSGFVEFPFDPGVVEYTCRLSSLVGGGSRSPESGTREPVWQQSLAFVVPFLVQHHVQS